MGSELRSAAHGAEGDSECRVSPKAAEIATDEAAAEVACAETFHDVWSAQRRRPDVHAATLTYRDVSKRIGVPFQRVAEWANPNSGRRPKDAQVYMIGPPFAPAYFRAIAARCERDHERQSGARVYLRDATMVMQESTGSVARTVRMALADGEITDEEEAAIKEALLAVEADVAATRHALAQHRRAKPGTR